MFNKIFSVNIYNKLLQINKDWNNLFFRGADFLKMDKVLNQAIHIRRYQKLQ